MGPSYHVLIYRGEPEAARRSVLPHTSSCYLVTFRRKILFCEETDQVGGQQQAPPGGQRGNLRLGWN